MDKRTALLAGATGLVGGHCLHLLVNDDMYEKIVILVRKPTAFIHRKVEELVVCFDRLEEHANAVRADDVYCCLGTTMKSAGSQEAFRRVDLLYPEQIGAIAAKNGASQLLLVSAVGANPQSKVFYNRVKGEAEQAVSRLPLEAIHIFRPSLLLGKRKQPRPGERLGGHLLAGFSSLMAGPLKKYRPIESRIVAATMVLVAKNSDPGMNIYESDRIQALFDAALRHRVWSV